MEKSLLSGSNAMLLLRLLEEKDMYGYEMIDQLRQKSDNVFELKVGTLYPLLHSLEKSGCLTSYEGGSCREEEDLLPDHPRGAKAVEKENGGVVRVCICSHACDGAYA